MKNLTAFTTKISFIILIGCFLMSFNRGTNGVRFQDLNFKEAEHQAQYRKKPMFMFISSPTCLQSQRMEENFKNKEISGLLNKNFFCNRYNTDNTLNLLRAQSSWGVRSYPTYIFFNEDGKIISKEEGYKSQAQTLEMVQNAINKVQELNAAKGTVANK